MNDQAGRTIRSMQAGDLAAVAAVEQLSNPHPWSAAQFAEELEQDCATVDLLCLDGAVAAFLCSWLVVDELQIQNVATHPGFRRRGLARTLLERRHDLARAAGATVALLEVRAGNSGAIRLYEELGYRRSGLRRGYYADGEDAVLMHCDLAATDAAADLKR